MTNFNLVPEHHRSDSMPLDSDISELEINYDALCNDDGGHRMLDESLLSEQCTSFEKSKLFFEKIILSYLITSYVNR